MRSKSTLKPAGWVATILLPIVLAGCASYHPRPLSAPANAAAFSQRSLDNAALRAFMQTQLGHPVTPWPPKTWTPDQLTLAALHYHPELAIARARWRLARAKAITAHAYPNPRFSLNSQYLPNPEPLLPAFNTAVQLAVPVITAGKRGYQTASALADAEAARLDVVQTAWQIRTNVRRLLINLYAAQRQVRFLNTRVQSAFALLDALRRRFKAGQTAQFIVLQARQQWTNAQLARADARAAESQARTALAGAVGVPAKALRGVQFDFDAVDELPAPGTIPTARLKSHALTQRPDIRAALFRYAASQSNLQLEIARQYPDIQIGPGYDYEDGRNRITLGLSLKLPIFNQNQGPIAEARARRRQMAAQFRALQQHVATRIDSAFDAYRAGQHKLKLAQQLLGASKRRLDSTRASYRVGEANHVELLRIQLETQGDRLALLKARVQAEQALAKLEDTLQQPMAATRAINKMAPVKSGPSHNPPAEGHAS